MAEPTTPSPARREGLWLWALAALVLLAIVIVVGVRACDDDEGSTNSGTPTATDTGVGTVRTNEPGITESLPETTPGTPEPDLPEPLPTPTRGGGTLAADGQDLYPALAAGSLAQFANQQVAGKGVKVGSVVGDDAFWVGRSTKQMLLVVLNPKGKTPPNLRAGQTATFSGLLRVNEGLYGVTAPAEKTTLERQGHHAFVSVGDLKLQ